MSNTLSYLRIRANLTQRELAAKVNVRQGSICNWERGLSKPTQKYLAPMAKALGCTVDDIKTAVGIEK